MAPRGEAAQRILPLLREGPRQAHEIAADLGIDTSAVRRQLEALRADGLVARELHVEGPGRPKARYELTLAGRETFPRDYALMLSSVLRKLGETRGRDEVLGVLDALARDLAAGVPAGGRDARLAAVLKLYNELGFEAHIESGRGEATLVQRNCIVLKTARDDPEALCDCFDEGILRAAFPDAEVSLSRCMATGDDRCCHRLRFAGAG